MTNWNKSQESFTIQKQTFTTNIELLWRMQSHKEQSIDKTLDQENQIDGDELHLSIFYQKHDTGVQMQLPSSNRLKGNTWTSGIK